MLKKLATLSWLLPGFFAASNTRGETQNPSLQAGKGGTLPPNMRLEVWQPVRALIKRLLTPLQRKDRYQKMAGTDMELLLQNAICDCLKHC